MTGCAADYCTNSSTKGFKMCKFPRNDARRSIWIRNVRRDDWIPGPSAALCHVCIYLFLNDYFAYFFLFLKFSG